MRAALPVVLFAVLLTTAGCSGAFGDDPASEGATVETTTTAPETDAASESPPGLTDDGLADADALVTAHADALRNRSVTLHERRVRQYANGTPISRTDLTVRTAANRTRFLSESELSGRPVYGASEGRVATFGDGDGIYRTVETPNTSWSDVLRGPNGDPTDPEFLGLDAARTDDLYLVLNALALDDAESVRATDDPRRYRLESSSLAHADLLASHLNLTEVRNASLSAVVTSDGVVEEYRLEYVGANDGTVVRGTTTLEYSGVGETEVETPPWYDEVDGRTAGETTAIRETATADRTTGTDESADGSETSATTDR